MGFQEGRRELEEASGPRIQARRYRGQGPQLPPQHWSDATGTIPGASRRILEGVGRWVSANGEAICGAGPTALEDEPAPGVSPTWRCTTKPGYLYATLFDWTGRSVTLALFGFEITSASLISPSDAGPLDFSQEQERVRVDLIDSVSPEAMPVLKPAYDVRYRRARPPDTPLPGIGRPPSRPIEPRPSTHVPGCRRDSTPRTSSASGAPSCARKPVLP